MTEHHTSPRRDPATRASVTTRPIFVFGSNLAGRHGKGAALAAVREHGAIYGRGVGPQGFAYAIPTKDARLATLPVEVIATHVAQFLRYAREHPELTFQVTPIGCGLAGYRPAQVAPLFRAAPSNCRLPTEFTTVLRGDRESEPRVERPAFER